jgi:exonuclease III
LLRQEMLEISRRDDALFGPEVRDAFHRLVAQGRLDAVRALHPAERIYTFRLGWRDQVSALMGVSRFDVPQPKTI